MGKTFLVFNKKITKIIQKLRRNLADKNQCLILFYPVNNLQLYQIYLTTFWIFMSS